MIQPLQPHAVRVEPLSTSGETPSGIYVVDHEWTDVKVLARVLDVGPDCTLAPGDLILCPPHAFEWYARADGTLEHFTHEENAKARIHDYER